MTADEYEYLEGLRKYAFKTREFLSNPCKAERERAMCRAFLRLRGIEFAEGELIAPASEPTDVAFRDARFQIRELRDNKPQKEWKERQQRYATATSLDDIIEPYSSPHPIDFGTLLPRVEIALSAKAAKYGSGCKDIDALVYIDLQSGFLLTRPSIGRADHSRLQGWRSVSLLFPPCGIVVFATPLAPAFIREAAGTVATNWLDIDGLFEKSAYSFRN